MPYNTYRKLKVELKAISAGEECTATQYVYNGERYSYNRSFIFILLGLHEILFGEIVVIIHNSLNRPVGIVKIALKRFLEVSDDIEFLEERFDILPYLYLNKADCYNNTSVCMGYAVYRFYLLDKTNMDQAIVKYAKSHKDILELFFTEDTAQIYRVAYQLFQATQKGTLLCRLKWLFGLVSAEYYYNYIYGECRIPNCDGVSCGMHFCQASYGNISAAELGNAMEMLQYAAAAFANSFVTWRLEKPRNMVDIRDNRRKAILDRLDIQDDGFLIDHRGTNNSLSFIAFISRGRMVISFKGTTCGVEAMHDLNCDYTEFQDGYVHRGIKLLAEKFLDTSWDNLREEMKSRNINILVLTGHSLGAAVSIIVYLIMLARGFESYLAISVVCFGCPPIVSDSIAKRSYPNILIYNYGHDIVTRLNFGSVLDLKYICISISNLYDYFTDKMLVVQKIAEIKEYLRNTEINTKLYHPGKIIHIHEFSKGGKTFHGYKRVDYKFFEDMISSRRAPLDHLIHRIMKAFKSSMDINCKAEE